MLNVKTRMVQNLFSEIEKINEKYLRKENTLENCKLLEIETQELMNNMFNCEIVSSKLTVKVERIDNEIHMDFVDSEGNNVYILEKYMVPKYKYTSKTRYVIESLQSIIDINRDTYGVNVEVASGIADQLYQYIHALFDEGFIRCLLTPHITVLKSDYVVKFRDYNYDVVYNIEDYYV